MSDGQLRGQTRTFKLCEGWLECKTHKQAGLVWEKLWIVLKDNMLFFFKNTNTTEENQIGHLTVDGDTTIEVNKRRNKKFKLYTGKRLNKFRSERLSSLELWRGFIMGVATGKIPDNLDLLPNDISKIQEDLDAYFNKSTRPVSTISIESGIDVRSHDSVSQNSRVSKSSSSSSEHSSNPTLFNGGPVMVHRFYPDRSKDQVPPKWFFSHCSRELAEAILAKSVRHGNTLMRESTRHIQNGSYVISKIIINERTKETSFEHFEVMRTAAGYQVNVENTHTPMKCLSEVMAYFVETAGSSTRPLTTNNLNDMGLAQPDYETTIYTRQNAPPAESWAWPPPDYDDVPPPRDVDRKGRGSQTVSAGVMKNMGKKSEKSVGWSPVHLDKNANSQTYNGPRIEKRIPTTSIQDIQHMQQAAAHLQDFNTMISGFDTQLYYNEDAPPTVVTGRQRNDSTSSCPPPPPPTAPSSSTTPSYHKSSSVPSPPAPPPAPPAPHTQTHTQHSYINDAAEVHTLPVAPPAPRVPSSSAINRLSTPPTMSSGPRTSANLTTNTSPVKSPQISTPSKPLSPTSPSVPTSANTPKSTALQRSKSTNNTGTAFVGIRSPGLSPNTGSPATMPTWKDTNNTTTAKAVGLKSSVSSPEVVKSTPPKVVDDTVAGVDDSNPGGVINLRSKFEGGSITRNAISVIEPSQLRKDIVEDLCVNEGVNTRGAEITSRKSLPIITNPATTDDDAGDVYEVMPCDDEEEIYNRTYTNFIDTPNTNQLLTKNNKPLRITTNSGKPIYYPVKPSPGRPGDRRTYSGPGTVVTNVPSTTCTDNKDDIYDDTVNPVENDHVHAGDRKVQFQTSPDQGEPNKESTKPRRFTEPDLSLTKSQFEEPNPEVKRLNPEFKNKLEGLFNPTQGQVTPGKAPAVNKPAGVTGHKPNSPTQSGEDPIYAEIPPDMVTYANTEFND